MASVSKQFEMSDANRWGLHQRVMLHLLIAAGRLNKDVSVRPLEMMRSYPDAMHAGDVCVCVCCQVGAGQLPAQIIAIDDSAVSPIYNLIMLLRQAHSTWGWRDP